MFKELLAHALTGSSWLWTVPVLERCLCLLVTLHPQLSCVPALGLAIEMVDGPSWTADWKISAVIMYCLYMQALGLASEVVDMCFKGTASRIGGVGFNQLAADAIALHDAAYEVWIKPSQCNARFAVSILRSAWY